MLITEFDMNEYVEVVREEYFEKGQEDERINFVRNVKSMKCDVAMISEATGLTFDEIEKIEA